MPGDPMTDDQMSEIALHIDAALHEARKLGELDGPGCVARRQRVIYQALRRAMEGRVPMASTPRLRQELEAARELHRAQLEAVTSDLAKPVPGPWSSAVTAEDIARFPTLHTGVEARPAKPRSAIAEAEALRTDAVHALGAVWADIKGWPDLLAFMRRAMQVVGRVAELEQYMPEHMGTIRHDYPEVFAAARRIVEDEQKRGPVDSEPTAAGIVEWLRGDDTGTAAVVETAAVVVGSNYQAEWLWREVQRLNHDVGLLKVPGERDARWTINPYRRQARVFLSTADTLSVCCQTFDAAFSFVPPCRVTDEVARRVRT